MSQKTFTLSTIEFDALDYAVRGNAVLGIRDSGKTYSATTIAEKLMDCGIPVIAFDPSGVWHNIKNAGVGKGYPVIVLGGQHADYEITKQNVETVVRKLLSANVSFIVDMFTMDILERDEITFVITKILLEENNRYGLRHVFFEEAGEFVNQTGKQTKSFRMIERLVRVAGNVQVGCTFINQRAEGIHKSILELCDGIFLHRQKGKNSIKAVQRWLDSSEVSNAKEITNSLASIQTGECWVWRTANSIPVRINMPQKNSAHPDRRRFSLSNQMNENVEDVLESLIGLKETQAFTLSEVSDDTFATMPNFLKVKKIDMTFDTSRLGFMEAGIVRSASATAYGESTVKKTIDSLISDGYREYVRGIGLKNPSSGKVFKLHSRIELLYAALVIKVIS